VGEEVCGGTSPSSSSTGRPTQRPTEGWRWRRFVDHPDPPRTIPRSSQAGTRRVVPDATKVCRQDPAISLLNKSQHQHLRYRRSLLPLTAAQRAATTDLLMTSISLGHMRPAANVAPPPPPNLPPLPRPADTPLRSYRTGVLQTLRAKLRLRPWGASGSWTTLVRRKSRAPLANGLEDRLLGQRITS